MPTGRPTDYDPKYCDEMIEYFDIKPYREEIETIVTKKGDTVDVKREIPNDIPTLAGFAVKIGVCRDTLYEWSKKHKEFSDVYKKAKVYQENYFAINGTKGLIQPAFSRFLATNLTSWTDQKKVEHSGEVKKEIKVTKIDLGDRVAQLEGKDDSTGQ